MANTPPENSPATLVPQDYHSILTRVIAEATRDPAQLRKLVYALASNFLKPSQPTFPPPNIWQQAQAMLELEFAKRQLERAIERIEKEAAVEAQLSEERSAALRQADEEIPFANGLRGFNEVGKADVKSADNAVIVLPERIPSWLVQRAGYEILPAEVPPFDRRYHDELHAVGYARGQRGARVGLLPFL